MACCLFGQAITWTNADLLSLHLTLSNKLQNIIIVQYKIILLKDNTVEKSSARWQPFFSCLNVLSGT